jgi:hypothetical protein
LKKTIQSELGLDWIGTYYVDYDFISDVLDGFSTFYHKNGALNWKVKFSNGKKNGIVRYYDSIGNIFQYSTFKNNELNGVSKKFYTEGNVEKIMFYKNGILHGEFISYYKSGQIKNRIEFNNGVETYYIQYDSLGNITNETIKFEIAEKNERIVFTIKNPLYSTRGVRIYHMDSLNSTVKKIEAFSAKKKLSIDLKNFTNDTIVGELFELDTLNDSSGIVKRVERFKYLRNQ